MNPLERASDALYDFGVKDSWLAAQATFGSIDTDDVAAAILRRYPSFCPFSAHGIAEAVKNWLTGKDQQRPRHDISPFESK